MGNANIIKSHINTYSEVNSSPCVKCKPSKQMETIGSKRKYERLEFRIYLTGKEKKCKCAKGYTKLVVKELQNPQKCLGIIDECEFVTVVNHTNGRSNK